MSSLEQMQSNGFTSATAAAVPAKQIQSNKFNSSYHPEQRFIEEEAQKLLSQPQFQISKLLAGRRLLRAVNTQDRQNLSMFQSALDQLAFFTASNVVALGLPGVNVFQLELPSHIRDDGRVFGGAKTAYDNPDTIYRNFYINGKSSYTIQVIPFMESPVEFTISILNDKQQTIGVLSKRDVQVDSNGSFEITLDCFAAKGDPNHMQIPSNSQIVLVRDTLSDWENQRAHILQINAVQHELEKGPRNKLKREFVRLFGASIALQNAVKITIEYVYKALVNPANTFQQPTPRSGSGALTTQYGSFGWFQLKDDEALIFTIQKQNFQYFGLTVTNLWTISGDCFNLTGSLNNAQAVQNNDGSYTFVVSRQDPLVNNYVNTDGLLVGTIFLRWQAQTKSNKPAIASVICKLVQLCNLKQVLPKETVYVTENQRKVQLLKRFQSVSWRQENIGQFQQLSY